MRSLTVAAILLACGCASTVQAGTFYLGANVGQGTLEAAEGGARFDVDETGYKGYVGYRFMKFVGVEVGYTDFGSLSDTSNGTTLDAEVDMISAFAVGFLPITPRLDLFGKVGFAAWDTKILIDDGIDPPLDASDDGTDLAYGFGISWRIIERLAIRGEWETNDIDNNEVRFGSVGLQFNF